MDTVPRASADQVKHALEFAASGARVMKCMPGHERYLRQRKAAELLESRGRGAWDRILGGFEMPIVQTLDSGNPLNFDFANSPFNYFPTFAGNRRPNAVRPDPQLRDNYRDMGPDRFTEPRINPVINIG